MKKIIVLTLLIFICASCSSKSENEQPRPPWVDGASRVVDNGYIVYVGQGEDTTLERAQFKAEGMALQDLANECSFTPKGTRVEDHFVDKQKYTYKAYAKVGIELQECDEAKKALEPETIKSLANVPFTEQVKKYQDLIENSEVAQNGENGEPLEIHDVSEPQQQSHIYIASAPMFYGYRQYVVYQKQEVIMAPPGAYPPQSPQSQAFVSRMTPVSNQIQSYETANPGVRSASSGYSAIPNKPRLSRPPSLRSPGAGMQRMRGITPPARPGNAGPLKGSNPNAPHRGRRRNRG